jgi:uridine phosphorylase
MERHPYPILEFDSSPRAVIEPAEHIERLDVPEHCVPCFFLDVIEGLVRNGRAREALFQFAAEACLLL